MVKSNLRSTAHFMLISKNSTFGWHRPGDSLNINRARHSGTVMNLKDRRHDLYSVVWHKKELL
jgi:hypothetical protein